MNGTKVWQNTHSVCSNQSSTFVLTFVLTDICHLKGKGDGFEGNVLVQLCAHEILLLNDMIVKKLASQRQNLSNIKTRIQADICWLRPMQTRQIHTNTHTQQVVNSNSTKTEGKTVIFPAILLLRKLPIFNEKTNN